MALTALTGKSGETNSSVNQSRWLKYVFLSFTQSLFSQYPEFKWEPNRATTKIIIQDKFSTNQLNTEKIPSIIFNRGAIAFFKTSMDQAVGGDYSNVNSGYQQTKTDMCRSNSSFSCLSDDQLTSEHIADILAFSIFTFRDLFREKGISSINRVNIGESNPIKMEISGNKVDMFNTPVYVDYDFQFTFVKNADFDGILAEHVDYFLRNADDTEEFVASE